MISCAPPRVTTAETGHVPPCPTAAGARQPEDLDELVARLGAVAGELTRHLPDPAQGVSWLHLDAALRNLNAALVTLGELDAARPGTTPPPGRGSSIRTTPDRL